jgi:lipopolysaccharide/colanic/teichoic acid biosynthesis glycosyltransferase
VVLGVGGFEADSTVLQSLIQSLRDRVRSTDEIGWFDDNRIGVLLPYTSRDGAQKFIDDIRRGTDTNALLQKYNIYSYPSHWHSDDSDGNSGTPIMRREQSSGDQLHFKDIRGNWDATGTETCTLLRSKPLGGKLPIWKRLIDIAGALFGLAIASPFLLIHTIILKTVSPGPVFFRQQRIGYMGRPFKMWKLRTMDVDVDTSIHRRHVSQLINGSNKMDSERPMAKLDNNPHIIPGGTILRKLCLDEVPQLINVLRGEMSLVGPRPSLQYEVEEFLKWQQKRFDAVPGMTGLWQVSGKNKLSFSKMIRLDIQYSRQKSLWLDLIILLKTPLAIVSQLRDSLVLRRKQQLMVEGKHV